MSFMFAILKNIHIFFSLLVIVNNDDGPAQPIKMHYVITTKRARVRHHRAPPLDNICSPDA